MTMSNYLNVLEDSLKKKLTVLDRIEAASLAQAELLKEERLDTKQFDRYVEEKDDCIAELDRLDEGFQTLYDRIKEELQLHRSLYTEQIRTLQKLIQEITDKSVMIQAQEARNRDAVTAYFQREKQELGKSRKSSKVAYGYYKSMDKAIAERSSYMDMKK